MGLMYKERVISLLDLRWLCITCEKCGTSITLDMARELDPRRPNLLLECQVCDAPFDSAVSGLNGLRKAFKNLFGLAQNKPEVISFIAEDADAEESGAS